LNDIGEVKLLTAKDASKHRTPSTTKNCGAETASSDNLRGYIFIDFRRRYEHARKHL
jgi:hypothetical protein